MLKNIKDKIITGLQKRMSSYENDKNLIFATMLDPRYKLNYFKEHSKYYRELLEGEIKLEFEIESNNNENFGIFPENPVEPESEMVQMFNSFLKDTGEREVIAITPSESKVKALLEVIEYLEESSLPQTANPFKYWLNKSEVWPHLSMLAKKYLSAPPGSVESERLFSTAGLIVNNLRKNLSNENLKMLLFVHHNAPLVNFEY